MSKVTIVMPVYNVEETVDESIRSALAQTYTDFELLIIDDEATDSSYEICKKWAEHDSRIRIIRQKNKGLAGARNTGIENAKGEYLAFLDSDDLWTTDKLARHVELLDENPEVGLSYNGSEFIDEDSRPLGVFQTPKTRNIKPADVITRNPIGNGSAPVIRAVTLQEIRFIDYQGEVNYFDASLRQSEDIECWVRIIAKTEWQFMGIEAPLTKYRVNEGGLSANVDKQFASWKTAYRKMQQYAPHLTAKYGKLAMAYQYRYLARRAIRSSDRANALTLNIKALTTAPQILIHEPGRTLITIAALVALLVLPQKIYGLVEKTAMAVNSLQYNQIPELEEEKATA